MKSFLFAVFEGTLPFLELGRTAGVDHVTLPALNDGVSGVVNIPVGFAVGNSTQTNIYVSIAHPKGAHKQIPSVHELCTI